MSGDQVLDQGWTHRKCLVNDGAALGPEGIQKS
jgi:hypothetical protein